MVLKHPGKIDGVLLKITKRVDCIHEVGVVDLRTEFDCHPISVDIGLPNVIKDALRLDGVAGDQDHKKGIMDGVGGKTDNHRL